MPRRTRRLAPQALAIAALVAVAWMAACQDYNFSPVRHCLIQPGTERVTLSDISTADVLFVVDDSGSMGGEQRKLQQSFAAFVNNLQATNVARVQSRLEPIDFHIAITTTSVFVNEQPATAVTCSATCGGAGGATVCCRADTNQPLQRTRTCAAAADCTPGNQCLETCAGRAGEKACCAAAGGSPELVPVTCGTVGEACGNLRNRYVVPTSIRTCGQPIAGGGGALTSCAAGPSVESPNPAPAGYSCRLDCVGMAGTSTCCADATPHAPWVDAACDLGLGTAGGLFPRGDFVRKGSNPRVLHFDKSLFCERATDPDTGKEVCACTLPGGPATCAPPAGAAAAIATLITQFQENIAVGTCGSPQEQGMLAARLAIQKALGQDGLSQPPDVGGGAPEWPHPRRVVTAPERPSSKLVVVFVGDEDDCSGPESASEGIILASSGNDTCQTSPRRFPVQGYADFLAALGRPVAGAFIVSVTPETCSGGACTPGLCCDTQCTGDANVCSLAGLCGGQGAGVRFVDLSAALAGKAADTVVGSVCNPGAAGSPGFSSILEQVAEVVKQPAGLQLPTQPAAAELSLLRIAGADGKTRKTCTGPAPAATLPAPTDPGYAAAVLAAVAAAEDGGYDWWFTGGDDTNRAPTTPTRFIYLNRKTRNCEANPGETYSADYLGLVPATGCQVQADCQAALGGGVNDWACCMGFDRSTGACIPPSGPTRGSCLCGAP